MLYIQAIMALTLLLIICFLFKKCTQKTIKYGIVVILSIIALIGFMNRGFWQVDSCLDSGGRYDYQLKKCED